MASRADQPTVNITSWANYFDDLADRSSRTTSCGWPNMRSPRLFGREVLPDPRNVRRDEMASFLSRALGLSGSAPDAFTDDEGKPTSRTSTCRRGRITTGCAPRAVLPGGQREARPDGLVPGARLISAVRPERLHRRRRQYRRTQHQPCRPAGDTTGCSAPRTARGNVTRGQMAAFLRRAFTDAIASGVRRTVQPSIGGTMRSLALSTSPRPVIGSGRS